MANARDLRLQADYDHLRALAQGSAGQLGIESAKGRPPDEYILLYHCRSIERLEAGKPVYRSLHRVQVKLPARYPAPSAPPIVRMLTPLFHPHVYKNREVCMGSWHTSEYLEEFALRLGALLQYDRRYLNVHDPANEEAVLWAKKNLILLPTDTCGFGVEEVEPVAKGERLPVWDHLGEPETAEEPAVEEWVDLS